MELKIKYEKCMLCDIKLDVKSIVALLGAYFKISFSLYLAITILIFAKNFQNKLAHCHLLNGIHFNAIEIDHRFCPRNTYSNGCSNYMYLIFE